MRTEINYIKLFAIIFFAVVLGNLTASGIKTWIVLNGVSIAMEDFSKSADEMTKRSKQQRDKYLQEVKIKAEIARQENEEKAEHARKNTQVGRSLARQCNEWTYANNANNNQYAREQKIKYCNAYNRYIVNGQYPNFKY